MTHNKPFAFSIILLFAMTSFSCETMTRWKRTLIGTGIGCAAGGLLGTVYDEHTRKQEQKQREKDIFKIFKEKKSHNKGKIIGLATGCLAGLGVGLYLDIMAHDMEDKMKEKGVTLEKVDTDGDGKTDELKVRMDGGINFVTGSAALAGTAETNVDNLREALEGYPETGVRIWGHTDGTGTRATNDRLSAERARSVERALGLPAGRIKEVRGFANTQPLPGTNRGGYSDKNRRVEVNIIPDK